MSITSANAVLTLNLAGLLSAPQQLQGFATDDIFDADQVKLIETQMGVDGILSGGFVYNEKPMNIHLQSNSPSIALFDQWNAAQQQQQDVLPASMTIVLKGLLTAWNCTNGFLTDAPPLPSLGKVIKPRVYRIVWNLITPAPVAAGI
jgi:hypothetical protein